jgi:hypothetical protein
MNIFVKDSTVSMGSDHAVSMRPPRELDTMVAMMRLQKSHDTARIFAKTIIGSHSR